MLTDLLGRQIAAGMGSFQKHGRVVQSRFKVWFYQCPRLFTYNHDTCVDRTPSRHRSARQKRGRAGSSSGFVLVEYDQDEAVSPVDYTAFRNATRMKFDAARVTGMIEKLADPRYQGKDGEASVADFVADQFTQIGMAVDRREVEGSRPPPRIRPWIGWMAYGALITAIYALLLQNDIRYGAWALILQIFSMRLLIAAIANRLPWGRRRLPAEAAPFVMASFPGQVTHPIRIVFHAVLGGLSAKVSQTFRTKQVFLTVLIQLCFAFFTLMTFMRRIGLARLPLFCWPSCPFCSHSTGPRSSRCFHGNIAGRATENAFHPDSQGLSVLLEMARSWPRTRSNQVEAIFVAAGGHQLDHSGSRELIRLLRAEWPSKPSLLIIFLAPGAGGELRIYEGSGPNKLAELAATSLWIPIQSTKYRAIAPFWPFECVTTARAIAIIGSDLNALSEVSADPQVLHRAIQLTTEIALRWAKKPQTPVDA